MRQVGRQFKDFVARLVRGVDQAEGLVGDMVQAVASNAGRPLDLLDLVYGWPQRPRQPPRDPGG